MAQTTYSLVTSLIPEIWEGAVWYAQHNFIAPRLVTTFMDRQGMTPRNVSVYSQSYNVASIAETDDISSTAFNRALLATLTPGEIGKMIELTDQRVETDPENIISDATTELGYTIGAKVEQDLVAQYASLTGGTIGGGSGAFVLADVFKARALLEARGVGGPYSVVLHPYHFLDVYETLIDLSKAGQTAFRDSAIPSYSMPGLANVNFYTSTMIPRVIVSTLTTAGSGGTYKIKVGGDETTALAYNANAVAIQAALVALPTVGAGGVTVTGSGPYTMTFATPLTQYEEPVVSDDSTTGGTPGANISIAEASAIAKSALFTRDAMAFDLRRGLRLEPDRDASKRATELNATMVYATGLWRSERGVVLSRDASTPS